MNSTNAAPHSSPIDVFKSSSPRSEILSVPDTSHPVSGSAMAASGAHTRRRYHRSPSKARMKLSR